MAWRKRSLPTINAGSMADIAFLLLIFFLVTTTMDVDGGIQRKLPPEGDAPGTDIINQRNLLSVLINADGKLLVEDQEINLAKLREATIRFLDNNGDGSCSYCEGNQTSNLSDSPNKAVISIQNDRDTPYRLYIAVQNELTAAYNQLRDREAQKSFSRNFSQLPARQQQIIAARFPQKISEAEPLDL